MVLQSFWNHTIRFLLMNQNPFYITRSRAPFHFPLSFTSRKQNTAYCIRPSFSACTTWNSCIWCLIEHDSPNRIDAPTSLKKIKFSWSPLSSSVQPNFSACTISTEDTIHIPQLKTGAWTKDVVENTILRHFLFSHPSLIKCKAGYSGGGENLDGNM